MDPGQSEKIKGIISKIQFIPDLPLKSDDELKFGHKEIAKTIKDIVLNANQSMTIGLFGSWGTGKSSIVYSVEKLLENETECVPTVIFDVWKHKDDALRRTFLNETVDQLKKKSCISSGLTISDSVSKLVESSEDKSEIDKQSFIIPFGVFCLVFVIVAAVNWHYTSPQRDPILILTDSFLFAVIFAFLIWLPQNMSFIISKNTTRIVEDKFSDPAQFEKEFIFIVDSLNEKTKKVLIVFDNLDRVTEGKAVEVLTTVKTFLEPKLKNHEENVTIIFLIPCDNEAIHKHIKNMYFLKTNNHNNLSNLKDPESEEFLNKFFNCKVTIPDFVPSEFEQFALKQLERSGIPQFQENTDVKNDVAWVIVQAYRNNPRRIIHFINDLSALYILLLYRVETGEFDLTFINENLPQIAKFLVIEKKFPECLRAMISEGYANPEHYVVKPQFSIDRGRKFKEFVDSTRDIPIRNIFLFSRLRLSESEKKIPGIHYLFQLMEQSNLEEILKYIEQNNLIDNESDFSNALKDELENKKIHQTKVQFIKSLFHIKTNTKINFSNTLYTTIYNKIDEDYNILSEIHPSLVHGSLVVPKPIHDRVSRIVGYWILLMPNLASEILYDLLALIFSEKIGIPKDLQEKYLKTLNTIPIDEKITSMFCEIDYEKQDKLVDVPFINKIVKSKFLINNKNRISRINRISPDLITLNELSEINTGLKGFLNGDFINLDAGLQKEVADELAEFIEYTPNQYKKLFKENQKGFDEFATFLIDLSRKIKTPHVSLSYLIEFAIITHKIENPTTHNPILVRINELLLTDPKSLKPVLTGDLVEKLYKIDKAQVDQLIFTQQKIDLYVIIYSGVPEETKSTLLNSTFKLNDNYGILVSSKIIQEGIDFRISSESLEDCIKKMTANPTGYPVDQRQKILEICNQTRCFETLSLIDLNIELIKKLLSEPDQNIRSGYLTSIKKSTFIPEDRMRGLIKHLHSEIVNHSRPVQTDIIAFLLSTDSPWQTEESNDLMQVIFDKILNPTTIQEVQELFGLLSQLKPQYRLRKQNFTDVKLKIEQEKDNRLKTVLIQGLLKLKPKSLSASESIDYWNQIETYTKS